jgi:hypothetical protein
MSYDVVISDGVVTTWKYTIKSVPTNTLKIGSGPKGFVVNFAYEISKHGCYQARRTDSYSRSTKSSALVTRNRHEVVTISSVVIVTVVTNLPFGRRSEL